MYSTSKFIRSYLLLFFICGCTSITNKTLSPPADTKWVHIEIKNPSPYTRPFPLGVRYISYKCMKKRVSGFDGSVITEPSYNVIQIPLQQEKEDLWKGQVAMTGGGLCQWTLSAIDFGIEYIEATHIGKDLIPGTAVGATVAFDDDASRNGRFTIIEGNRFYYSPKYYPFIKKWKDQKNPFASDKLYLFGKGNAFWDVRLNPIKGQDVFVSYYPGVDESKKVEMIFPYEKKKGATYTFVYPNGEKVSSLEIKPDFDKLEMMK